MILDTHDPRALGRWWRNAFGWIVVKNDDDPGKFGIRPTGSASRTPLRMRDRCSWRDAP
jgi:hypothetical protein